MVPNEGILGFLGHTGGEWVAVKELNVSYYIEKNLIVHYIYPILVTLFKFLNRNPGCQRMTLEFGTRGHYTACSEV